ncbi:replication restart DNA helicase PriA [Micromonospora echinaurantiaca]|uniref:Probable replication restart protein PriA n=1 Tax=Micromonospora echinaurantiaca TaxID=47857 RepID=A0A1C5INW5_9ACTN|nr:primosomal protein N' [Micromonospora echinaurantiaca]SCG59995.1 replication restart DNA helicase PriA [Micromonospora echinaurantiaca]
MDVPLAHLDRPFDYLVPAELNADATPGVRVKVRFAGQLVDGWLLSRGDDSGHTGRLAYLEKVVSPEPVLAPEVARLARAVADRYAGSLADVLRLAVPPRHARVEKDVRARAAEAGAAGAGGDGPAAPPTPGSGPDAASDPAGPEVTPPAASAAVAASAASVAEAEPAGPGAGGESAGPVAPPDPHGWRDYPAGPALLRALTEGRAPRAVWSALPGEDWPARYAEAVAATVAGGRGALVVVADNRDLDRLDAALTATLGAGRHVCLSAALGPARRYRAFLAARRGDVPVVIGTRAAMFAPVDRLGLVAIWDDGDDLHAEPRAPYPHAREVLLTRAQLGAAAALVGGYARTAEAQLLVETGWAREVVADRATVRARMPAIAPTGDDPQLARDPQAATARLPSLAWTTARDALRADRPVLVQVPRRGYLPAVACADCRSPARCPHCAGPLALPSAAGTPACRWCGRVAAAYACPHCGGRRLRASVTGARRTAEELGRAFPGVPVRTSGREEVLAAVPGGAGLVIATPGAEPVADGGYGAVLLLDSWALLTRADLRAGEEALRRWLAAAALARPGPAGGRVVVVADGALAPVQALLRWDAAWFAERELAERRELGFPPAVRMASVTGQPAAVADLLAEARLPAEAELLGPVPADAERERMLVRVPRARAAALAEALHSAAGVRTARKAADPVRLQVDPLALF